MPLAPALANKTPAGEPMRNCVEVALVVVQLTVVAPRPLPSQTRIGFSLAFNLPLTPEGGAGVGVGTGVGAGLGVGTGVGTGVGAGEGDGFGVGTGVGEGFGVGAGVGVGFGVPLPG